LAVVQRSLIDAAMPLLRPGGVLVYSVCTLTDVEGPDLADALVSARPDLDVLGPPPVGPWEPAGATGYVLRPSVADTDGMFVMRLRATS
jgi:16S rRNA (cytosine967-C5)-methyltransferase